MGREVRKVPPGWRHPKSDGRCGGEYKPLHYGAGGRFEKRAEEWLTECAKWQTGERPDYAGNDAPKYFWDWGGMPPSVEDYMLVGAPDSDCTHFALYEDTTEGTPLSPAFATLEEVAEYAAAHCSTFADFMATKEGWLRMLQSDVGVMTEIAPGIVAV